MALFMGQRDQGAELLQKLCRGEQEVGCPIRPRRLELEGVLILRYLLQTPLGQRRPRYIVAEPFQTGFIAGIDAGCGMDT